MAEAERRVAEWERGSQELRARLEDPALYLTADAAAQARRLGVELEAAKRRAGAAFAAWEAATEAMEATD